MPSFTDIALRTDRLVLRPFEVADAPGLLAVVSDPEVARYLSRPAWTSLAQACEAIARHRTAAQNGEYVQLAVIRQEDGLLLGDCCLFKMVAGQRRAEIGYSMRRDAWGHGYMNEALHALITWGFDALDLHRIEADIDPRNAASARVLQRHGFTQEGLLRERWVVAGEVSDSAIYGLLRTEWAARTR